MGRLGAPVSRRAWTGVVSGAPLTVYVFNGLCNRMRAVDSALAFALPAGRPLTFVWPHGDGLVCPFASLFEALPDGVNVETVDLRARWSRLRWRLRRKRLLRTHKYLPQSLVGEVWHGHLQVAEVFTGDPLFVETCSRITPLETPYAVLRPRADHVEAAAAWTAGARGPGAWVGVHVRRGDKTRLGRDTALERFVVAMTAELETTPDVRFLLATDEAEVERALRAQFGERVVSYPKREVVRDDPASIVEALIDLLLLSMTDRLIGSAGSSFSETAAELTGIPLALA